MKRSGCSKSRDGSQVDPSTGLDSKHYPELTKPAIITDHSRYIFIWYLLGAVSQPNQVCSFDTILRSLLKDLTYISNIFGIRCTCLLDCCLKASCQQLPKHGKPHRNTWYNPGTILGLLGQMLEHGASPVDGDRGVLAFYMHNNIHEYVDVSCCNYMEYRKWDGGGL